MASLATPGTDDIRSQRHVMAEREVKDFSLLVFYLFHLSFFIRLVKKPALHQYGMQGYGISKFIIPLQCLQKGFDFLKRLHLGNHISIVIFERGFFQFLYLPKGDWFHHIGLWIQVSPVADC